MNGAAICVPTMKASIVVLSAICMASPNISGSVGEIVR